MFKSSILCSLAIGTALLVGCDDKKETTVTVPAAPTTMESAKDKMGDAAATMKDKASDAGAAMKDKAGDMKDGAAKMADDAKAKMGDMKDKMAAPSSGAVTDDATTKEATTLLEQVKTYMSEKKFDDADAALTKLEGMKDKLPASISGQLPQLRTALNAAKGGLGGVKLPGLGQ